ncbi:hypothetical protein Tco_0051225 [Tanacetum coccineum]
MMYYQIIRADGSSKNYKIFSGMLDDFDRQDMVDLYRLVKERYETTSPEGYDLLLWGDLKTLFEPIHVLLMDIGIAIDMMVEMTYPLIQEMLSGMLNRRLEVDHESEMEFELLRFTRSQLQKSPAPLLMMTEAVITTSIASVPSILVPEAAAKFTSQVQHSIFHDSSSTSTIKPDVAGPSHLPGKELLMGSREINSEPFNEVFVPQWNVLNDNLLDNHDIF